MPSVDVAYTTIVTILNLRLGRMSGVIHAVKCLSAVMRHISTSETQSNE